MIVQIGDDPLRDGLLQTPDRVARSWEHLFSGYNEDPASVLGRVFHVEHDQMIVLRGIEFYSTCEHHILPFFGRASIAYLPDGKEVVGISKLARLVEVFARRLQVQERLTDQIADAIVDHLKPKGVGVRLEAKHLCMVARGVQKQQSDMVTTALRGSFQELAVREEFFRCVSR